MAGRTMAAVAVRRGTEFEASGHESPHELGRSVTDVLARAIPAVVVGSAAPLSVALASQRPTAAAAGTIAIGAALEATFVWADGHTRRLAASLAILAAALFTLGPVVGRSTVIVLCSTVFLAHLALLGWVALRSWPRPLVTVAAATISLVTAVAGLTSPVPAMLHVLAVFVLGEQAARRHAPGDWVPQAATVIGSAGTAAVRRSGSLWRGGMIRARDIVERIPPWVAPAVGLTATIGYVAPLFYTLASNPSKELPRIVGWFNDFPNHIAVAERLSLDPFLMPPHPLFHIVTRVLSNVVSTPTAATLALTFASIAGVVGLRQLAQRPIGATAGLGHWWSVAFAVFVMVSESPAALTMALRWTEPVATFASFHVWNSPTETIALGATALLLPALLDGIDALRSPTATTPMTDDGVPLPSRRLLVLTLVATIAKPSFSMVLVPALPAFLVVTGRWRLPGAFVLVRRVVGASLAVLVVQVSTLAALAPPEFRVGITWAPFSVLRHFNVGGTSLMYFAGPAIVLLAVALGGRRYLADTGVGLSWVALGIALVPMIFLAETGPMANDGNVGKLSVICWFAVCTTTMRFIAGELAEAWRNRRTRVSFGRAVLTSVTVAYAAVALAAGAALWIVTVGSGPS